MKNRYSRETYKTTTTPTTAAVTHSYTHTCTCDANTHTLTYKSHKQLYIVFCFDYRLKAAIKA